MSNKLFQPIIYDKLIEDEYENYEETLILSFIGLALFLISVLILIFYIKKIILIKSKPFIFILVHSITNLIEIHINKKELFIYKCLFSFASYLFQFHQIISEINKMLMGKQIFKSDKDYSIKRLKYYEIIIPIIFFPYAIIFQGTEFINFCQYLSIIVILLCFYEYVKNKLDQVIKYINEINKDNIEIAYMEPEELDKIYIMSRYLWVTSFILILLFYITKFFDILLRKIKNIHYVVSLVLLCLKETLSFILFIGLISIVILLNKSYDKGQIIQTEDDESLNMKKCGNKLEIELDDINIERDNKNNDYNSIEKANNIEDNTIEIDNLDIKNGKDDNTNKNEEEKLDEEDENLNINKIKETDKLK
jgi:hypothetical protein